MIAAVGCESRGRMILPTPDHIMTLYRSFYGVRALISYQPGSAGFRPKNWISADTSELFNLVIEGEENATHAHQADFRPQSGFRRQNAAGSFGKRSNGT